MKNRIRDRLEDHNILQSQKNPSWNEAKQESQQQVPKAE